PPPPTRRTSSAPRARTRRAHPPSSTLATTRSRRPTSATSRTPGSLAPPTPGDLEAAWPDAAGNDLYEVRLAGEYVDLRIYGAGTAAGPGRWAAFLPDEWQVAGESARGGELSLPVRGLSTASPESAGTSPPIQLALADQDID